MSLSAVTNWTEPTQAHAGEVRKLSTLLEASQALSGTPDLKVGLHRVLEILGRHHGALRSTVVLRNEHTGEVEVEASVPRSRRPRVVPTTREKASPARSFRAATRWSFRV